jgi:hypothetical protein
MQVTRKRGVDGRALSKPFRAKRSDRRDASREDWLVQAKMTSEPLQGEETYSIAMEGLPELITS